MRFPNFALHNFNDEHIPFEAHRYSFFKNGYLPYAKQFGNDLALGFYANYDYQQTGKQIVVFPSPYYYIPSACSFIKDSFITTLNRCLVREGRPPALESKIHRDLSYHSDYGKMSLEERQSLIANDKFHIDREFIKDKFCIFLDDVRITGSHEMEIEKMLVGRGSHRFMDYCYVYFANYTGNNCKIEDFLNNNAVCDNELFKSLTSMDDFYFNVRNIKRILSMPPYEFSEFIANHSVNFNEELYDWSIGNRYHTVEKFYHNTRLLRNCINSYYQTIK